MQIFIGNLCRNITILFSKITKIIFSQPWFFEAEPLQLFLPSKFMLRSIFGVLRLPSHAFSHQKFRVSNITRKCQLMKLSQKFNLTNISKNNHLGFEILGLFRDLLEAYISGWEQIFRREEGSQQIFCVMDDFFLEKLAGFSRYSAKSGLFSSFRAL